MKIEASPVSPSQVIASEEQAQTREWWARILVVAGVVVGAQDAAYFGADASTMLGALLVGAGLAFSSAGTRRWIPPLVGVAAAVALSRVDGFGREFLYAVAFAAALLEILRPRGRRSALVALLPITAASAALDLVPQGWILLQQGCEWLSGSLSGGSAVLGPTAFGFMPLLGVTGLVIAGTRSPARRTAAFVASAWLAWIAFIVVAQALLVPWVARQPAFAQWLGSGSSFPPIAVVGSLVPAIALLAALPLVAFVARRKTFATAATPVAAERISLPRLFAPAATGCVCAILALWPWGAGSGERKTVYFLEKGLQNLQVPTWDQFGQQAAGMFGLMAERLKSRGYELKPIPTLTELDAVSNDAILLVVNPNEVTDPELAAFDKFVAGGGSALVLGDHTDIMGTKGPTNRLLEPLGLRLREDSGFAINNNWESKFGPPVHWLLAGNDQQNVGLQLSTGATIEFLRFGPRPLLVARHAFSDASDPEKRRGDLRGDYALNPGEELGDRCVAAEVRHGAGRAIVFADTSSFQNLGVNFSWPLVSRLFNRLSDAPSRLESLAPWVGAFGLAACAAIAIGAHDTRRWSAVAACVLGLSAGHGIATGVARANAGHVAPPADSTPVAFVDLRHASEATSRFWQGDSINGLLLTLVRSGYEPFVIGPADSAPSGWKPAVHVLVHPRVAPSSAELESWLSTIEQGAIGLVALDGGRAAGHAEWSKLGVSIGSEPLGPLPIRPKLDPINFGLAMREPQMTNGFALTGLTSEWTPRVADSGRVVIAERKYGAGRLVVIGDSRFLLDRSLESETEAWVGNLRLVASLVRPVAVSEAP